MYDAMRLVFLSCNCTFMKYLLNCRIMLFYRQLMWLYNALLCVFVLLLWKRYLDIFCKYGI